MPLNTSAENLHVRNATWLKNSLSVYIHFDQIYISFHAKDITKRILITGELTSSSKTHYATTLILSPRVNNNNNKKNL